MGAGVAGPRAPGETGDEPEEAGPRQDRVVPPYVDDLARRGRQQREPERAPAGADEPGGDAARAGATAQPAASSAWSAWSSARTGDQDTADAGRAGVRGPGAEETGGGIPVGASATPGAGSGTAAGAGTDAAGETGDHGSGAGARGRDAAGAARAGAASVGADRAGAASAAGAGSAPGRAGRPAEAGGGGGEHGDAGADEPGETAGAVADAPASLDDQVTVVPGVPRYHRRGCILIRFLSDGDLETTTRHEAEAGGSVPCKACQPDKPAPAGQV